MKAGIDARLVARLTGDRQRKGVVKELVLAARCLLLEPPYNRLRQFQKGLQAVGLGHHEVTQVSAQRAYEVKGVESLRKDFVKLKQRIVLVSGKEIVHEGETVVVTEHIEVLHHLVGLDVGAAESHRLVENRQGVTHGAVGLHGDDMQGLVIGRNPFPGGDIPEIADDVRHADAVEVVSLATGQYGRKNLMLLGRSQDEDGVCRGFFERLEEGVEGGRAEHMDLIDDEYAVAAGLRRNVYLFDKALDVFDRVVGGGVELMDAVGTPLRERPAAFALAAGLHVGARTGTVDGLCKNTRGAGLADSAGTAEKIGMRQLPPRNGVFKGLGDIVLADKGGE